MPNLEVNIDGLNELLGVFQALPQQIRDRAQQELNVILAEAVEEAIANAPVLEGPLRESITGSIVVDGDNIGMVITADTPYANKLHEWTGWNLGPVSSQQPTTPSGGVGPKYIERVFMTYIYRWQERIGKAIVGDK